MASEAPRGFAWTPEMNRIFGQRPDWHPTPVGGRDWFYGVTRKQLEEALHSLPEWQREIRDKPFGASIKQILAATAEFPTAHFIGYRVVPEREDERIVIEAIVLLYVGRELAEQLAALLGSADDVYPPHIRKLASRSFQLDWGTP